MTSTNDTGEPEDRRARRRRARLAVGDWRERRRGARLAFAEDRIDCLFQVVARMARELESAGLRMPPEVGAVMDTVLTHPRNRPRPSARERWRDRWWHVRGEITHYACYWLAGDVVLAHLAPARMRRAAWADGYRFALGGGQRRWLRWMHEHADGWEAGAALRLERYPDGELPPRTPERIRQAGAITDEDGRVWS
jgi:hypothetical protein